MAFNLSAPQTEFFLSEAPIVAVVAGLGSGKTTVSILKILSLMFKYPKINVAYAAPSHPLIRQILFPKVSEILEESGIGYKINKAEGTIAIEGHGMIITKTLDNPDLLVGFEVGAAFLDELDLLSYENAEKSFMKMSARIRQKLPDGRRNTIHVSTTPEGYKWCYQNFIKKPLPGLQLIRMSTYSNAENLPKDYIQSLEDKFGDSPMLDAYLNGEFVSLEGNRVISSFNRQLCVTTRKVEPTDRTIYVSCDFNVTKMQAVIYVKDEKPPHPNDSIKPIISGDIKYPMFSGVDEITDAYDTPDVIAIIKERYGNKEVVWYPDASSASRKTVDASKSDLSQLREVGVVKANSRNPAIKDRVASTDKAFKEGCVKLNPNLCPDAVESLEHMTYDKNGKPDKSLPCEHKFDATTYLIAYEFPVFNTKATVTSIQSW